MNFLHAEPILIGMYVCCLWGGGKVPISANRNTSGPQPRWLRRCTNILEIHQTRKLIEMHLENWKHITRALIKARFTVAKTNFIDCKSFALPPFKNRIFQPSFKL